MPKNVMTKAMAVSALMFLAITGPAIASCEQRELSPVEKQLIGRWKVPMDPTLESLGLSAPIIEFRSDGTAHVTRGKLGSENTSIIPWESEGEKVTIKDINQVRQKPDSKEALANWTFIVEKRLLWGDVVYIIYDNGQKETLSRVK